MTTVAVLCGHYLPGFKSGGPIRSLSNLVDRLGDEIDFAIITSDRDLGDSAPYPHIHTNAWNQLGKARVFYRSGPRLGPLAQALRGARPDVLYLNSFFSPRYTISPLVLRKFRAIPSVPIIVAPRGEFSSGALAIKTLRKRVYLALTKLTGLYADVVWHASTANEADDIRRHFGGQLRVIVAPNLSSGGSRSDWPTRTQKKSAGQLKALFLSRISPKKNLLYALQVLGRARSEIALDIYGPIEDRSYWERCLAAVKMLPANISAKYRGSVHNAEVADIMCNHELLILPTLGENFGHVIVEALNAGCPVLISDQTPWRDLQRARAGWDLPLACPEKFSEALDVCAAMEEMEFLEWSDNARRLGRSVSDRSEPLEQHRRLFAMPAGVAGQA